MQKSSQPGPRQLLLLLLIYYYVGVAPTLSTANVVILEGPSSNLRSENATFELLLFAPRNDTVSSYFLGIRYASVPAPTYVWVANATATGLLPSLHLTTAGRLAFMMGPTNLTVWETDNEAPADRVVLMETGNLVLLSSNGGGAPVWQSFDYPSDTWLPGMNLTNGRFLTSWAGPNDPSPGAYTLLIDPDRFDRFWLVYNGKEPYWSTGDWTGSAFSGVPEMTIPYIYKFHFDSPKEEAASFWFTEAATEGGGSSPLTRFRVESNGLFRQYTWSQQTGHWDMFWSRPDDVCKVYGVCGPFGVCNGSSEGLNPCTCLSGFRAINGEDYRRGCRRRDDEGSVCGGRESDGFAPVRGTETVSFPARKSTKRECEKSCLGNCSCVGFRYDSGSRLCENLYGEMMNLRGLGDGSVGDGLYLRVSGEGNGRRKVVFRSAVLFGGVVGLMSVMGVGVVGMVGVILVRRRRGSQTTQPNHRGEVVGVFPELNLKVFSYKELSAATRGFSDKLGQGGFGAVFLGKLEAATPVAVKRLERPGSGEKEFRAEVRTIGNIQHVNLVRLRGFCSESAHRLLVYDYMPNGPLSAYLQRDSPHLSWDVRFRVALGTARGITYLHEGCRDCIIHCDIKPENILLDGDYIAKVSDFGLAKLMGRDFSRVLASMRGTWGYVAPEWISGVAITTKADVYSYGMTLLELLGGRRNVEAPPSAGGGRGSATEIEKGEKWFFPPYAAQRIIDGDITTVVDDRLGNAYNAAEAMRLALVAVWCIQDEEEMRPAMGMVVKMLAGVVEVATPPQPKLLQALVSGESYRGIRSGSGVGESHCNSESSPGYASSPADCIRQV